MSSKPTFTDINTEVHTVNTELFMDLYIVCVVTIIAAKHRA